MSTDFEDLFNFEEKYGEPATEGSPEFGYPTFLSTTLRHLSGTPSFLRGNSEDSYSASGSGSGIVYPGSI